MNCVSLFLLFSWSVKCEHLAEELTVAFTDFSNRATVDPLAKRVKLELLDPRYNKHAFKEFLLSVS